MSRARVVAVVLALTLAAGCAGSPSAGSPSDGTAGRGAAPDPGAPGPTVAATAAPAAGRTRLDGFGEITVTVVGADGRTHTVCLLLADTEELRQRGLMYVTDPELGGYDGMLFLFEADSDGGFWMRHTRLGLSIAYVRADGATTSTTDMAPCPDSAVTCPTYPSGGSYRYAVEVPQGRLGDLGLSDRSRMTVGDRGCAPR
jgi:uncharacterized membrane protein (UPF0127 family)